MADRLIKTETLTDIADAIREKKETTATIRTEAFAAEIRSIVGTGGGEDVPFYDGEVTADKGATATFTDDYTEGKADGIADGIEQGKKAERDAFWDIYQVNGERKNYQLSFQTVWNDDIYNPKYPIVCEGGTYNGENVFSNSQITDTKVTVTLIDTRADYTFRRCRNLRIIRGLHIEGLIRCISAFEECNALEDMPVTGILDVNGFDVHWSTKLNKASHESIVAALSTTTTGLTVTFSKTAVNKAFETAAGANDGSTSAEWAALVATRSNWTIALA